MEVFREMFGPKKDGVSNLGYHTAENFATYTAAVVRVPN
jgi:hypothetical protein